MPTYGAVVELKHELPQAQEAHVSFLPGLPTPLGPRHMLLMMQSG